MRFRVNSYFQDMRYLSFKMEKIRQAKENGNDPLARRHAHELTQYFGMQNMEGDAEDLFIESSELESPFRNMVNGL